MKKQSHYEEVDREMRLFHCRDGGFSTVGMVVALLVTLSLTMSAAQVYRVYSLSCDVRNVADVTALAAENQVASSYVVAQVCDAIIFSLTLTAVISAGVGSVALCIPSGQSLATSLLDASSKMMQARNRFADTAAEGLNALQRLLPAIAAIQAASVASENDSQIQSFRGTAIIFPLEGVEISSGSIPEAEDAVKSLQDAADEIAEAAKKAEEAAVEAKESKQRAFMADCGNEPSYCMSERARTLAGLVGADNPIFSQVDHWSFQVALDRARIYYGQRLRQEQPENDSIDAKVDSELRRVFYAFATQQLDHAFVYESEEKFESNLPLFPRQSDELRTSDLYTQEVFPTTVNDQSIPMLHAWEGCPIAQEGSFVGYVSLADAEASHMEECPECQLNVARMASVAAASSSISNGFEYHWRIVAEEATRYEKLHNSAAEQKQEAQKPLSDSLDRLVDVLKKTAGKRIDFRPPGRRGAIAAVANTQTVALDRIAPTAFVASEASLGPSASLSAATLAKDPATSQGNIINSLLDRVVGEKSGILDQVPQLILNAWGFLLHSFSDGYSGVEQAIQHAFSGVPLISESGLVQWVHKTFTNLMKSAGLQPASLDAWRPVTINSWHVMSADGSDIADALKQTKRLALSIPDGSSTLFHGLAGASATVISQEIDGLGSIHITDLSIPGTDKSIPIEFTIPENAKRAGKDAVYAAKEGLVGLLSDPLGVMPWR